MKKTRSPVILSAAKDLRSPAIRAQTPEILRCAQDDIWRQVWNGILIMSGQGVQRLF
jgi:hypothetical protein